MITYNIDKLTMHTIHLLIKNIFIRIKADGQCPIWSTV